MSSTDLILMGLGNLFRRKMRSLLTVLGVVIGTTSILVMISVGLGLDRRFEEETQLMGSLTKIEIYRGYGKEGQGGDIVFNDDLVRQLSQIEKVKAVVPTIRAEGELFFGKTAGWAEVKAVDFSLLSYLDIELSEGRMPKSGEVLVGREVKNSFWEFKGNQPKQIEVDPMQYPLEFKLRMGDRYEDTLKRKGMKFITSGIMANEDYEIQQTVFVSMQDYEEFVARYMKKYKIKKSLEKEKRTQGKYSNIQVFAEDIDSVESVMDEIKKMGMECYSETQWLNQAKSQSKMIQAVLGGVGGISLIVAAIGITNTMVMSIYERTKEIGVMKVIGAKVSDIRKLFLVEAAFIGMAGGIIGVGLSYIINIVINTMVRDPDPEKYTFIKGYISELYIPWELAVLGVLFAMAIGILAGMYPSIRATRISALDAIRTD